MCVCVCLKFTLHVEKEIHGQEGRIVAGVEAEGSDRRLLELSSCLKVVAVEK